MTLPNINITAPNTGNTFFVKEHTTPGEYIQCPVAEATGIAILRYIPVDADTVAGEVYALGTLAMTVYPASIVNEIEFTASGTSTKLVGKTVYVYVNDTLAGSSTIQSDGTWSITDAVYDGDTGAGTIYAVCDLAETDEENLTVVAGEITNLATDPSPLVENEPFDVSCDSNLEGKTLTFERSDDGISGWTLLGTAEVSGGSAVITVGAGLTPTGTYFFRAVYSDIESGNLEVAVESGTIVPTNEIYATHDIFNQAGNALGDMCNKSDDSLILLYKNGADTRLAIRTINSLNWSSSGLLCTSSNSDSGRIGAELQDSTYVMCMQSSYYTIRANHTASAAWNERILSTELVDYWRCGIAKVGAYYYYLGKDAKIYRTTNHVNFTLVKDLSAIITASNSAKPMTYNDTDDYLYILDGDTLYAFDLSNSWNKVCEITMPTSGVTGIVYHKTRIHYICYVGDMVTVKVLKNSNDA